ncbi:MAG: hypothetical protein HC849_13285 [Oscillatoriales cyanobacterium RU_3_3]|nr:hypothetical protein [Microcoleus sp. SU_5_3]NJL67418.1 hypothetical protein [Microcoleus sp. SM1_3_4]NJM60957.1 hypothetical protein [Oscillatoriales cyanobacterium RU_3_3]
MTVHTQSTRPSQPTADRQPTDRRQTTLNSQLSIDRERGLQTLNCQLSTVNCFQGFILILHLLARTY